jgi:predicted TIM-barrel fold metal-dependent hydrolase
MNRLNPDRVMVEMDYPHADSTWPDTQHYLQKHIGHLPDDIIQKVTWKNAAALYGLDIPASVQQGSW